MEVILNLLKQDLGITHTLRDEYFLKLIEASQTEIESKGAILNIASTEDQVLIADYAAWVYRKRQEDIPLANNIRYRIRTRVLKERSKCQV